jgi:hypothetical protein
MSIFLGVWVLSIGFKIIIMSNVIMTGGVSSQQAATSSQPVVATSYYIATRWLGGCSAFLGWRYKHSMLWVIH